MKRYFTLIKNTQELLLAISIVLLASMPNILILTDWITDERTAALYLVANLSLFFVMTVRPLADLLTGVKWLRPLVILRKGMGVLSASIIVAFIAAKVLVDPVGYLSNWATFDYWSIADFALFAHAADLSAILLLVTSNNLSKRLLGPNWKRLQRLSYVYFYGSSIYLLFVFGDVTMLWYLAIVTFLTVFAWARNHHFILQPATN